MAIGAVEKDTVVEAIAKGDGWVKVRVCGIEIYGVYISPNINAIQYERKAGKLFDEIARSTTPTIVVRDFNAKSALWGSPNSDGTGELWEDHVAATDQNRTSS